jgi:hypothetical protein
MVTVFATTHQMTRFITGLFHVEHVLPSPFRDAAAAESLQMACAASELAIADVKPFIDLTRPGAATWKGVLGVQTDGRLHRPYALRYHASAAGLQREHACSGRIVSIAEKAACLFDNPTTLSVLPKTVEHAPQKPAEQQPIGFTSAGTRSTLPCIGCVSTTPW